MDQHKSTKKYLLSLLALLLVVGIVLAVLELTNTTYLFHSRKAVSGNIPVQSPMRPVTPSQNKNSSNTNAPSSPSSSTNSSQTTYNDGKQLNSSNTSSTSLSPLPLQAPFGTFVSNHSPDLSGSPSPSTEQSICNTTPGATCTITFTNNGVVKTLPAQTTDSYGEATWTWDVNTAGFSVGDWHIVATATLSGQSKSTPDSQSLKVGP